jgi:hypothetical protein
MLPHKTKLEQHLKQRYGELFGAEFDVLLYDLTSTYVEGAAEKNPMIRRGYSRDHRPDCEQMVIALKSSEKIWTIFRSDSLSASWNTYLPPANVLPGTCTGSLNWNSVFLFHSSAKTGRATNNASANRPPRQRVVSLMFIPFLLYIRISAAKLQLSSTGASTCSRQELAHVIVRISAVDFKGIARSFAA